MDNELIAEVEELEFHQATVATDANTPLHLIKEKELEISGRMLAAKREADVIVSEARKQAADMVAKAEREVASADRETVIMAEATAEAQSLKDSAATQAEGIRESIASRSEQAVARVLDAVTRV